MFFVYLCGRNLCNSTKIFHKMSYFEGNNTYSSINVQRISNTFKSVSKADLYDFLLKGIIWT